MANKIFINRLMHGRIVEYFPTKSYSLDTDKFDDILNNKESYKFKFTKIYNEKYYEAILDTSYRLERLVRSLVKKAQLDTDEEFEDSEDLEDLVDLEDMEILEDLEGPEEPIKEYIIQDENYTYEMSPISDEMIVFICDYILESENVYYNQNLFSFLRPRKRFQDETSNNKIKISDYILYRFKYSFLTLKIKSNTKTEYNRFKELKNSYLFNFMMLNNEELTTENKDNNRLFREMRYSRGKDVEPFEGIIPVATFDSNLITYYKKAMTANDIFSKYLSYYHIIEYYFDRLYNDDVVKKIQYWLKDVTTLRDDESILKFADKVKKLKGKSSEDGQGNEHDAFVFVLRKYLDIDKLKPKLSILKAENIESEFKFSIQENNMLDFYVKNSVEFIGENLNLDFNNENTAINSIKNRIYKTRNSLVHSKDNYKLKTYHPYDDEKSLIKEIPLIKLIAEEIITNSSELLYTEQ